MGEKVLLILDKEGKDKNLRNKILSKILEKREEFEVLELEKMNIEECVGCFECYKRNNRCILNDDYGKIKFKKYKRVILISRIVYGMHSSLMKKVLDRRISYVTFIKEVKYDMYIKNKVKNVLNVGYSGDLRAKEKETFLKLWAYETKKFKDNIDKAIIIEKEEEILKSLGEII
ncbi:MAG: hypothetical protein ACRC28_05020 [Clostridium sp.]|uniref:hypothetical protein n=1 Tax=Clostridium sp. TaxID=1506 RepID=UPI003F334E24